jgi:hypothetical protein
MNSPVNGEFKGSFLSEIFTGLSGLPVNRQTAFREFIQFCWAQCGDDIWT